MIKLDLRLSDTQFDLIDGSFDLAIRNSAMEDSSLKGRTLAKDTCIPCAAPSYLKEHGNPKHPDALGDHYLIAFRNQNALALVGPDDGMSLKAVTLAGAGISTNSLWNVHEELLSGALVRVLPEYKLDGDTALWLIYPKTNVLSPKVRVFMDFLIEKIGKCAAFD